MKRIQMLAFAFSAFSGPALAQGDIPECGLYAYRADIVRVVDGDTVVADIDLGFDIWLRNEHLRLSGIDAPERGTDAGEAATNEVRTRIEGESLYVCTIKAKRSANEAKGSFGRYLVEIYHNGENLNLWLLANGFAVPFER